MKERVWRRAVGFGFRLLYNECAFTYDFVSYGVSLGHWRRWQRAALRFLPDTGAVLELAHGTGATQLDLIRAGCRCVGLDLSPNMGRLARRKLKRAGLSGDLTRGDAMQLPFADASFSAIVCAFPTAFIVEAACIDEMCRVLEDGGVAIIVLSGALNSGLRQRMISALYRATGQGYGMARDEAIRQMFGDRGFSAEARTLNCGGSVAQVALLRKCGLV